MTDRVPSASGNPRPALWVRVKTFFYESWLELKRVHWPSREDVIKLTGLVVAVVIVVGLYMYVCDTTLAGLTRWLFER